MRKLLATFLAASMITSIAMTSVSAASTKATFTVDMSAVTLENSGVDVSLTGSETIAAGDAELTLYTTDGYDVTFTNRNAISYTATPNDICQAFAGQSGTMNYNGTVYTITLANAGSGNMTATVSPAGAVNFTFSSANLTPVSDATDGELQFNINSVTVTNFSNGSGGTYDSSNQTIDIEQVVYSDSSGTAVPLVEDKDDLNGQGDGVRSGATVYFLINEPFDNDNYFKLKVSKGENSKNISSISVVSKYFTNELYNVFTESQMPSGTTTGRHSYIKVELNELYADDEYKITYDLKVSLTSDGEERYPDYEETSIKEEDITTIWLKNKIEDGDGEYRVGEAGKIGRAHV